jgi:hypothetical protein
VVAKPLRMDDPLDIARDRVLEKLVALGRKPDLALIDAYVQTGDRLLDLYDREKRAKGSKEKLSAARAINSLVSEQRKLSKALFGAETITLEPERDEDECEARLAADEAWRRYMYEGDRSLSEARLERKHGRIT